jgi:hypothetical protein
LTDRAATPLETMLDRHWRSLTVIAWVVLVGCFLWQRWGGVTWLALGDTDDNMRLMQVRGLLGGQEWYDLRQHRLNPPEGFNIHWSRLVDLPIAALILLLKPLLGLAWAERLAVGIAPLLPLVVTMAGLAFTVRRLVAPAAYPLAFIILTGATAAMLMFMPLRIDHHGWQLAMLSLTVAGLADERRLRGGVLVGLASATSLTIGLEMLPYTAMAGAIVTLRWVWDGAEARRLMAYALTLGGGSAAGYVGFASYDNAALRCDALTPVWLSVVVAAGGLLFALGWANPASRAMRLGLAAAVGGAIVAGFAAFFPQCLQRPEGVSDELARTWLNNVREARPIYLHPFRNAFPIAALPVAGAIGAIVAAARAWRTERFAAWATVALFVTFATLLLLWQVRAGPAAQLLAVPGATALAWIVVPWCLGHRLLLVRVLGSVTAFLVISGLFAGLALRWLPIDRPDKRAVTVNRAAARCASLPAMRVLDRLLATTLFTHVDLGPRLITLTHHDAVAGPYHRNGEAILDVHRAFQGTPERFLANARAHGATHLLICPNLAETTVYRARAPQGFYARLAKGERFVFLVPVKLPKNSPFKLWRIDRGT